MAVISRAGSRKSEEGMPSDFDSEYMDQVEQEREEGIRIEEEDRKYQAAQARAEQLRTERSLSESISNLVVDSMRSSVVTTEGHKGLRADTEGVAHLPQKGEFCAVLCPLALARVTHFEGNMLTVQAWTNQDVQGLDEEGLMPMHFVFPALMRRLWYRDSLGIAPQLFEGVGPGTILIERATHRLLFLGPSTPEPSPKEGMSAYVEVLADWEVRAESGALLHPDRFSVYQIGLHVGWGYVNRFGMIG